MRTGDTTLIDGGIIEGFADGTGKSYYASLGRALHSSPLHLDHHRQPSQLRLVVSGEL
jgi:hypothetical protein